MNKRWLYGLYICLSKELSISRSWSLYIINLRCGSATTQHPRLASPPPVEIISLSQHFTSRTTIQNINQGTLEQQTRSILFSWAAASHKVYCEWRENLNDWRSPFSTEHKSVCFLPSVAPVFVSSWKWSTCVRRWRTVVIVVLSVSPQVLSW